MHHNHILPGGLREKARIRQRTRPIATWSAVACLAMGGLLGMPAVAQERGQLLYETHCIACHSAQVHWREKKLALDWSSLRWQVQRWQVIATLNWSEDDVTAVARHLNRRYYHFPEPVSPVVFERPL